MLELDFPYVVEPMQMEDVPQVMSIESDSFPLPWPERAYRYELNENINSHYVVLRKVHTRDSGGWHKPWQLLLKRNSQAPVLGYGGFWMIAGEAHISTLAVDPPWRQQGLGELLLWSMLQKATTMGAFEATLEVRVSNHAAQKLYHKYGFEKVGQRRRYYQDNGEDAWIMTVRDFDSQSYQARLQDLGEALHKRLWANVKDQS